MMTTMVLPRSHLHEYLCKWPGNIRTGMRFAKNFQFISCCNLTYAYAMRLLWVSHATLCKFHKTYTTETPHTSNQNATRRPLELGLSWPIRIKGGTPEWIFFIDGHAAPDDFKNLLYFLFRRTHISTFLLYNLIVINRSINCTVLLQCVSY